MTGTGKLLGSAAVIAALLLAQSYIERGSLICPEYRIRSPKLKKLGDREVTLAFLSDLHDNDRFGSDFHDLLAAVDHVKPDLVLIGGDMMIVKKEPKIEAALLLVRELSRRHRVYYADGNHEMRLNRDRGRYGDLYDRFLLGLSDAGAVHLLDKSVDFGDLIRISGLNITQNYYRKFTPDRMEASYIERHLGPAPDDRFQVLLAHSPLVHEAAAEWGADLMLAGHFHGGTIRFPDGTGLMTPQYQLLRKDVAGFHEKRLLRGGVWTSHPMIVSAGLGTHSINIRLNDRPEMVVVRLAAAGQDAE